MNTSDVICMPALQSSMHNPHTQMHANAFSRTPIPVGMLTALQACGSGAGALQLTTEAAWVVSCVCASHDAHLNRLVHLGLLAPLLACMEAAALQVGGQGCTRKGLVQGLGIVQLST